MAVNKNFVVKNGLEVNDNLLVADQTTQKVGIGTSVASYTLHVRGGIGATEARVTGVSTFVGSVHAEENFSSVGITTLASAGGITTTGGDLYIGGDLYVLDDVVYDEVTGRNLNITGVSTFAYVDINDGDIVVDALDVTGVTTGARFLATDVSVSGVSTFAGLTTVTTNTAFHTKALNVAGLSTFVGVGTFESDLYVGGSAYITGDLTFDEFTARNASITGITTTANLHVGTSGTVINATDAGVVQIGSATTLATVTINGGSVPSIGLTIALGG